MKQALQWRLGPALASAPLLAVCALVAGCGDAARQAIPSGKAACAQGEGSAKPPADFPAAFPLPRGTVINATRPLAGGFSVLEARVPGEIEGVRDSMKEQLPKEGFALGEGDAEEQEAETDFSGHGISGHLKLHTIAECPGALTLEIAYRENS